MVVRAGCASTRIQFPMTVDIPPNPKWKRQLWVIFDRLRPFAERLVFPAMSRSLTRFTKRISRPSDLAIAKTCVYRKSNSAISMVQPRRGELVRRRCRGAQSDDGTGYLGSRSDASAIRYNSPCSRRALGASAPRSTRKCDPRTRAASPRSDVPRTLHGRVNASVRSMTSRLPDFLAPPML